MIKTFGDEHKKHNGNKVVGFDIKFAVKVLKITHIHNGKTAENQCYILLFGSNFAKVQNHLIRMSFAIATSQTIAQF